MKGKTKMTMPPKGRPKPPSIPRRDEPVGKTKKPSKGIY
jgi:hypothetical protein